MGRPERRCKIVKQQLIRPRKCCAPGDENIIRPLFCRLRQKCGGNGPQSASRAVARNCITDLATGGKTDAESILYRLFGRRRADFQGQRADRFSHPFLHVQKFGTPFQPHCGQPCHRIPPDKLSQQFAAAILLSQLMLGGQFFAAVRAAIGQHLTAAFGSHASTKAMTALAHDFAWLVGALHESNLQPENSKSAAVLCIKLFYVNAEGCNPLLFAHNGPAGRLEFDRD